MGDLGRGYVSSQEGIFQGACCEAIQVEGYFCNIERVDSLKAGLGPLGYHSRNIEKHYGSCTIVSHDITWYIHVHIFYMISISTAVTNVTIEYYRSASFAGNSFPSTLGKFRLQIEFQYTTWKGSMAQRHPHDRLGLSWPRIQIATLGDSKVDSPKGERVLQITLGKLIDIYPFWAN